jgi:chromosome segregation ATPase
MRATLNQRIILVFAAPLATCPPAAIIAAPASAQTAPAAPTFPKVDPSLIPGLRSQMLSARAEAQAVLDKGDAAKREMDQRRAELDRWNAQIADVDKDKALYLKNLADYNAEVDALNAAVIDHNNRHDSVDGHNPSAVVAYKAEKAQLDARQNSLDGPLVRLNQEQADYLARYDTIKKQTDPLHERIATLSNEYINSRYGYARLKAKADYLEKLLAAQGVSPGGP